VWRSIWRWHLRRRRFSEEWEFHRELLSTELRAAGLNSKEVRQAVKRRLGPRSRWRRDALREIDGSWRDFLNALDLSGLAASCWFLSRHACSGHRPLAHLRPFSGPAAQQFGDAAARASSASTDCHRACRLCTLHLEPASVFRVHVAERSPPELANGGIRCTRLCSTGSVRCSRLGGGNSIVDRNRLALGYAARGLYTRFPVRLRGRLLTCRKMVAAGCERQMSSLPAASVIAHRAGAASRLAAQPA
jgi:hypothetical protein